MRKRMKMINNYKNLFKNNKTLFKHKINPMFKKNHNNNILK